MISDESFKQQITKHDEFKIWAKKLQMLKKGLNEQLKDKNQKTTQLKYKKQIYEKLKGQIEWKNKQNQTLVKQIKIIKDQILQQRNKKNKLRLELLSLQNELQNGSDQGKTVDTKKDKQLNKE